MFRSRLLLCAVLLWPAAADAVVPMREPVGGGDEDAPPLPAGTRVARDVAYGPDPRQAFDVYLPTAGPDAARPAPVIVMVHGGGWFIGDKQSPNIVGAKANRWLPRGFILVSVNYRMLPDHGVAEQAEDVARALAFVQARAAAWGGDPARVVLMGHSAGAQLVALLSSAPSRWTGLGLKPWLGTVALDGAAIDTEAVMARRHFPLYDRVFGADPASWRAVSPLAALQPGALPLLAVCSSVR